MFSSPKSAFSLVELSIVLVILGLLTGGILTGQSLIKAAELRAVTTEFSNYQAAVNSFKTKYFALPGDMNNATLFWGKLSAHCNSDAGTAQTNGTCNGNGDGFMNAATSANTEGEEFMFWNQLTLAGLIEGQYTGIAGTANARQAVIGMNVPASRYSSGGWSTQTWDNSTGSDGWYYSLNFGNYIIIGGSTTAGPTGNILFPPEDAWNLDKKTDDGKPAKGKVVSIGWNNYCAAADDGSHAATDFESSYKLSEKSTTCALIFRSAY